MIKHAKVSVIALKSLCF